MSPLKRQALWIVFVLITLTACSGGESGTGAQPAEQTTVGEITGFGSIIVNGIHFDTDQVETIEIDDDTNVVETDLEVGMVVTVVGTVSADGTQGVARQVLMSTAVEGLVFQNNYAVDQTLNVMQQTINITNDTHFNSSVPAITDFDQIATTTAVEVHGYTDGLGEFFATMVNVVQDNGVAPEVKLLGRIQNLSGDDTSGSFDIGGITVQYVTNNPTSFDDGLQPLNLANDLYVEVESNNYSGTGDVLASEIERADLNENEGGGYELEGVVTDIANIGNYEFSLNGQRIVFDPMTTLFEGGSSADIQLDGELEVEGVYQNGALQAHEITFHVESDMEVEGLVTSINYENNTLTVNGINISVNELTSYEDEVDEMNHFFSFNDIVQNETIVHIKYYYDDTSMVNVATQIERRG